MGRFPLDRKFALFLKLLRLVNENTIYISSLLCTVNICLIGNNLYGITVYISRHFDKTHLLHIKYILLRIAKKKFFQHRNLFSVSWSAIKCFCFSLYVWMFLDISEM